ncbi:MAG: DUF192 domain-containing protein [Chloroflexi bacterium]|nr:DUF192 domain-containing protein [Chloroflexota bacterium]
MGRLCALVFLLSLALFVACGGSGRSPETANVSPGPFSTIARLAEITFEASDGSTAVLTVEIADTPQALQRGLMFRDSLPEDQGMLFDLGYESQAPIWMKDTSIPLSVAFISADGVILNIQDMQPFSEDLHRSPQPYSFAVEVNQGWFERHGVEEGSRVELPLGR